MNDGKFNFGWNVIGDPEKKTLADAMLVFLMKNKGVGDHWARMNVTKKYYSVGSTYEFDDNVLLSAEALHRAKDDDDKALPGFKGSNMHLFLGYN